jgi:hypothetical protein
MDKGVALLYQHHGFLSPRRLSAGPKQAINPVEYKYSHPTQDQQQDGLLWISKKVT